MDETVVIKLDELSKAYKLYDQPIDRLKEALHPCKRKYHKEFYAVKNLNLTIYEGEAIGIIGKNGSGKSTLLKMITGVLTPTTGKIEVNGKISALLELGAGFNSEYTGLENIYLNGTIMGYSRQEIDQKLDDIISFADIGDFIHQPVKMYSSGMFVRLAFAVAIAIEPDILIIDEALAVGDIRFQQKAIRKMKDLMGKAKAIIFVTHDMRSVRNFCSRVLWLSDGVLLSDGEPKAVVRAYEDYMLHGILPGEEGPEEEQEVVAVAYEQAALADLPWEEVPADTQLGGGQAQFTQFAFCPHDAGPYGEIVGTETLSFFAKIRVHSKIKEPLLGFGIFNNKGMPIVHFNSGTIQAAQLHALLPGTEVCVKYHIKLPGLCNGDYFIAVGLDEGAFGEHSVVHRVNECYCFKVNRRDRLAQQYGTVILPDAEIQIM